MSGLIVERQGECIKCGACCFEANCPHFDIPTRTCLIYETREQYCEQCKKDHSICVRWPVYPVKFSKPQCGYKFIIRGTQLEAIRMELVNEKSEVII